MRLPLLFGEEDSSNALLLSPDLRDLMGATDVLLLVVRATPCPMTVRRITTGTSRRLRENAMMDSLSPSSVTPGAPQTERFRARVLKFTRQSPRRLRSVFYVYTTHWCVDCCKQYSDTQCGPGIYDSHKEATFAP